MQVGLKMWHIWFWGVFFVVLNCPFQRKFGSPYQGKAQQLQEQCYPLLLVFAVFLCVQTMVWLPVFAIFNMSTVVDACECTRGLYGHCRRVCSECWLWEKTPLPHWGLKPVSVLHLAFQSDALPTELSLPTHASLHRDVTDTDCRA